MTTEEAYRLLGISSSDGELVADAFEQKLFDIKRYFLQKPPLGKLVQKRIHRIERITEAAETLSTESFKGEQPVAMQVPLSVSESYSEAVAWLSHFEQVYTLHQMRLQAAMQPGVLITRLIELSNLYEVYIQSFRNWAKEFPVDCDNVKESEDRPPDTGVIVRALRQVQDGSEEGWPVLCAEKRKIENYSRMTA